MHREFLSGDRGNRGIAVGGAAAVRTQGQHGGAKHAKRLDEGESQLEEPGDERGSFGGQSDDPVALMAYDMRH
jgi:hypothetical protein